MPIDHLVSSQVVTTSVAQGQVDGLPAYRFWLSDNHGALTLDIIKGVDRMEASENSTDGITSGTVNGLASISWIKNGYGFTLVGDRSERELRQVASGISLK
ncbi:MAG: hypothetical protein K8R88_02705 [Armatimonadetes bacterium]|nr:hypothetical protein [Armatimonadota bacterium]